MIRSVSLVLLCTVLAGCSALPSNGPSANTVDTGEAASDVSPYEVFDIDASTLAALQLYTPANFSSRFTNRAPAPTQTISVGDQLQVTIWEAAAGGLFSGSAGSTGAAGSGSKSAMIPPQVVDRDGSISIPYAGRIRAAGRSPAEVAKTIEDRLKDKAIEPQALVALGATGASTASVAGDVTGAARVPLNPKGDRLLEVVSQAGGIKAMPQETRVRLTRGNSTETVLLDTILKSPQENIYVYPGDQIYIYRDPPTYVALGAVTAQRDYPIDQERLMLAQAVAKAGGLVDTLADSSAIFLFRYESPTVVRALRPHSPMLSRTEPVPVVYRLNFNRPESYFFAQRLQIRDKDLVYVANAPTVQFGKFVTLVRSMTSTYGALRSANVINN